MTDDSMASMAVYKICDNAFASTLPIPELEATTSETLAFTFRLFDEAKDFPTVDHWLNHWELPDGEIWLSFAKLENDYLLQFPQYANFLVALDGRSVGCYPKSNVPVETIRHLLLNQVIPLVLSHLGRMILHASACLTDKGVMAFMGMTGAGKSTLAASFALRGLSLITDDCLLLKEEAGMVKCVASYPGSRLWTESISALFANEPEVQTVAHYSEKKRLVFEQPNHLAPFPLRAVHIITEPEDEDESTDILITPLMPSEALLEIVKHSFQLDQTDRNWMRQAFRQYERVAKSVPFFRLTYPRDFALLATVQATILAHLEQLNTS